MSHLLDRILSENQKAIAESCQIAWPMVWPICRLQKQQAHLIEVHVDALELQVRVAVVRARRIDAVLVRDHLQERIRLLTCVMCCATQD